MDRITKKGHSALLHCAVLAVLLAFAVPNMASGVTYDLVESGSATTRTWNSGKTKKLSEFVYIKCPEAFHSERLLVAFRGYREPKRNADNFITQLSGVCRRYGPNQGWVLYGVADLPPVDNTKVLFKSDHRSPRLKTEVELGGNGDRIPIGVHLEVNTNEYVKDIRILYKLPYDNGLGGTEQSTAALTGLNGNGKQKSVDLRCPTDYALTGTSVKYSTNNGKIRVFKIDCRRLVHR